MEASSLDNEQTLSDTIHDIMLLARYRPFPVNAITEEGASLVGSVGLCKLLLILYIAVNQIWSESLQLT